MNTQHLREFLAFAETLNYSTAAARMFVARPTLVDHVHALEEELGCRLVTSDQRQARLTPVGRRFVPVAQTQLETWENICNEFSALADNLLTVTVASANLPWIETLLYKARREICEAHPDKRIEVETDYGPLSTVDALFERRNDIVVAGYKSFLEPDERPALPEDTRSFPLDTEEIKLLVTQGSPLFQRPEVRVADLDGVTFVLPPDIFRSWSRDGVQARLERLGARVNLLTQDFSDHTEYFTYDFGEAIGIVPTTLVPRYGIDTREECRAFGLADMRLETSFFAVFRADFVATENGGLLFETMRRLAAERRG